jgi:hypothetical protein
VEYTVRLLTLYRDLYYCAPDTENTEAGSAEDSALLNSDETLTIYRSGAGSKQFDAEKRLHLLDGKFCGYALQGQGKEMGGSGLCAVLPAGKYLFTQAVYADMDEMLTAAEQVWLESLWRDITPLNDMVYIRTVVEDNRKVFQVFRQVPGEIPAG